MVPGREVVEMPAKILDGRALAIEVRREVVDSLRHLGSLKLVPHLAVVTMGEAPDSRIYMDQKEKACDDLGIILQKHRLPESAPLQEALSLIRHLNADKKVHGILIQYPLPTAIESKALFEALDPAKDVEGLHPLNAGRLLLGLPTVEPCSAAAIVRLLEYHGVGIEGRNAVIVGRSAIVGKPTALMLMAKNATVTVCHTRTRDLAEIVRQGDIVVAALGSPRFITADMVKPGAVVLDAGFNVTKEETVGDVDYVPVAEKASWITPPLGGIGPATIAMLMKNITKLAGYFA